MKKVIYIMRFISRLRIFNPTLRILKLDFHSIFIKVMKSKGNIDFEKQFNIAAKINGCNMILDLYKPTQRSIYCSYKYEREITNLINRLLKKDGVFIDVGAHVGYYSLLAAKIVKDKGKVLCFEPNNENFKRLNENVKLNRFDQIKYHKVGLSDYDGEAQFYINPFNDGGSSLTEFTYSASEMVTIKVAKLDTLLRKDTVTKIDLLKIDVEGHQMSTLKGMEHTLLKFHPKIIVEFNGLSSRAEIIEYLSELNYTKFVNVDVYDLFCT